MSSESSAVVASILTYLNSSAVLSAMSDSEKDSLSIARDCLTEAFPGAVGVSAPALEQVWKEGTASLKSLKSDAPEVDKNTKQRAEALKAEGNACMSAKDPQGAIKKYTEAIELDPTSEVYYSNRSAAYSNAADYENAAQDAQTAIDIKPSFARAHSRLGHALYCQDKFEEAVKAYEAGLALDKENKAMASSLEQCRQRAKESGSMSAPSSGAGAGAGAGAGMGGMPDLSALAGMMGGAGGGAGGMPDLASLMQNPQLMQMAQSMMANGGMERLMSNPALRGMAERAQSGGGMPSMAELANDPALSEPAPAREREQEDHR